MNHGTPLPAIKEGLFQRYPRIADIPRGRGERVKLTLSGHLPVNNAAAKWRVPSGQALGAERTRQWTAEMW
jgi:hypothetical protein